MICVVTERKLLLKFSCSGFSFQTLFSVNPCQHPIVILKDVKYNDLKTMVDFMYYGEVNVSQEQLPAILKVLLLLKSLCFSIFCTGILCVLDPHVMAHTVSYQLLTPEVQVRTMGSPCGICDGKSGTRTGFSLSPLFFLLIIIPLMLCFHSCIIISIGQWAY
jgi:hypothetical protein